MGSSQSVPSAPEITDAPLTFPKKEGHTARTENGQKTQTVETNLISTTSTDDIVLVSEEKEMSNLASSDDLSVSTSESDYSLDEEDDDFDFDSVEEEKEADEFIAERRKILDDARKLREIAGYYHHPEKPVEMTDPTASARCFFSRFSAEIDDKQGLVEEEAERELIMTDVENLKKLAADYLHPEKPVASVDATAFGRNYFTRASAPECDDEDTEEEREHIMEDMKQLKTAAEWYLQPEKPVEVDSIACARNYFSRFSAPKEEDMEERERVLEEASDLKKMAEFHLHPEKPVVSDSTSCGRNYFSRSSAPEYDDEDTEEERERILEDMKQMKMTAEWYLKPEKPVEVDPAACGRNYFSRLSAPEDDDMDERERILEDAAELKKMADWHMNPEKPVVSDSTACGRNYFTRYSAPENDDEDMEEERETILEDMKQMKMIAEWYLKPEKPIDVHPTACGRNFFSRPSAYDDVGECLSWEVPSSGWHLSFDFQSRHDNEMEEERKRVLSEASELKKVADWYLHPEKPIATDPTSYGRNYFTRPSAIECDSESIEEEREQVLSDVAELKKVAEWYMHPEQPVTVFVTACGRNYFNRPSAPEYEEDTEEERDLILEEAAELMRVAEWYMHPEEPVIVYSTATGRNFFTRPSAPELEEDMEERDAVLADALELKNVAEWYMYPERPVTFYATASGRNYFTRPSAPINEDEEALQEVLSDARELKMVAEWYMHPEKPVTVYSTAFGRNYFTRPSALTEDADESEERNRILAEAKELKTVADWYLNPDKPVVVDANACGRNYFSRPSAPEYEDDDVQDERNLVIAEAKELKDVASWYYHPEKPVTSNIAVSRNYFTRPSAPFEDEEERTRILADSSELKKVAVDFLHPEKPVVSSSINCARNYFNRPSAPGHDDFIHTAGHANDEYIHTEEDYSLHYDDYHHHDTDHSSRTFQSQSDHFPMDEDVFHGFNESMNAFKDSIAGAHTAQQNVPIIKEEDGKEGNLSRSPSSIMLFDEQTAM